jgi:3,4-dihydroxy 2-butanone 4-phosphate synthase/GTP cyclohydrolase II
LYGYCVWISQLLIVAFVSSSVQYRVCKNFKLHNGLSSINSSMIHVRGSDLPFVRLSSKFPSCLNAVSRIKAALTSGGGDLKNEDLVGVESAQPNAVALGTLGADTALTGSGFADDNDDFDSDSPTKGFASIPEAIEDIRNGKVVTRSLCGYSINS